MLLTAVLPLALHAVNTITYTATYDMSQVTMGTDTLGGVTYTTVHYDGLWNSGNPGSPSLPVDYIRFSVPYNATNFSVSATLSNNGIINLQHLVYPCQEPRQFDSTWSITLPDSSIYYNNAYYPVNNAWVVDEGFLAGENHIVTVAVMPISYLYRKTGHVVQNQLRKTSTIQLALSYELSDTLAMYPIIRMDTVLRRKGFKFTQSLVANAQNVEAYAPVNIAMDSIIFMNPSSGNRFYLETPRTQPIDSTAVFYGDQYDPNPNVLFINKYPYLIITSEYLYDEVRRIAALKRQKGYQVKVVTIEHILNDSLAFQGDIVSKNGEPSIAYDDTPGIIRQYLKYAYKYLGTKYVLLAGEVPYRYAIVKSLYSNGNDTIPTDMYYSELNADWSSYHYEIKPDLYVGRIVAKSKGQIQNFTDKLLRYELNPGHGNLSYLKKALFVESEEFKNNFSTPVVNTIVKYFNFDTIRIKEVPGGNYPKASDVIDSINSNPVGYISIFNHGSPGKTRVYDGGDGSRYFIWYQYHENGNSSGLNFLTNKFYPSIFYSPSCETIRYNHPYCTFGEAFTTGKDNGGPVYIGFTTSIPITASYMMEQYFLKYLRNHINNVGIAYALSKDNNSINELNSKFSHNLLGDPEVEMWTDIPKCYHGATITRENNTITISGIDTDSTIIAICGNNGVVGRLRARTANVILSGISSNSSIMLYKHNYLPIIFPLILQNTVLSNTQYVIASDYIAGKMVDNNRTQGDVTVPAGVKYEIEASGVVRLEDGFNVEKGATFAVYPSSF